MSFPHSNTVLFKSNVDNVVESLSHHKKVIALYLFGSQLTSNARKDSDIDIAVVMDKPNRKEELEIMGYCSDKIDISILHRLPLAIQFRVLKEGKLLYCNNSLKLHRIKIFVIKYYLDFASFINKFYRRVIDNV